MRRSWRAARAAVRRDGAAPQRSTGSASAAARKSGEHSAAGDGGGSRASAGGAHAAEGVADGDERMTPAAREDERALMDDIDTFITIHMDHFDAVMLDVMRTHSHFAPPPQQNMAQQVLTRAKTITQFTPTLRAERRQRWHRPSY